MNQFEPQQQNSAPIGIVIGGLIGGGAERFVLTLAEGLTAAGHRVDLLLRNAKGEHLPAVRGLRICTLHARKRHLRRELRRTIHSSVRIAHFGPRWSPLWLSKLRLSVRLSGTTVPAFIDSRMAHDAIAVADYIRRERPRALLANLEGGEIVALCGKRFAAQKTRVVAVLHSAIAGYRTSDAIHLAGIILPWAEFLVGVSTGIADDAARAYNLPHRNISVVYNPVKVPASLATEEPAHAWFKDSPGDVILAAGGLYVEKDFPTLLRAFARLADKKLRLVVVGEGGERAVLEKLAGELGIAGRVDFPGWIANPFALMARAQLFVCSSRSEGFGYALVEAMACGCPVVSTDCPHGPREILEDGKWGALAPVGDDAALAEAMETALSQNPDRTALKRRAEFFSTEKAVKEYEKILLGNESAAAN